MTSPLLFYDETKLANEIVRPDTKPTNCSWSGCYRLAFAVLEEALSCLYGAIPQGIGKRRVRAIQQEARSWIASDDTSWPYSFVSLCDALGLDAEVIRAAALREGFRLQNQGPRSGMVRSGVGPAPTRGATLRGIDQKEARNRAKTRKKIKI